MLPLQIAQMDTPAQTHVAPPDAPRFSRAGFDARGKAHAACGWGRFPVCESDVHRPEKFAEMAAVVAANSLKLIARGAGRAYGDAALNAGNRVVEVQRLNRMLEFDDTTAILRCEAGVTLDEIISVFLPRGFFPPVVPGTRFVTLGGSVAADVHGKTHHRDSSLGTHVRWFDLLACLGRSEAMLARRERRPVLGDGRRDGPDRRHPGARDCGCAGSRVRISKAS